MRISASFVLVVTLLAAPVFAKTLIIPTAASAPGSNLTYWRTDVRIYNPSATQGIDVTLHFLPQGEDGRNISGQVFHVGKKETLVLDNVVSILAPTLVPAVGAIRIDSDTVASFPFVASSRTYTDSRSVECPGSFGQFIPAFDPAGAKRSTVLLHVTSQPQFRTNAGVMNPGLSEITVRMKLLGRDGSQFLESAPFVIPPMSMRQWSTMELFGGFFAPDAIIRVETTEPVYTWASIVDNWSGDAIFVPGADDDATVTPLLIP